MHCVFHIARTLYEKDKLANISDCIFRPVKSQSVLNQHWLPHRALTSLQFGQSCVLALRHDGWCRLVALSRGSVHGHHPQVTLVVIFTREQDAVALPHGVEEEPSALQVCGTGQDRAGRVTGNQSTVVRTRVRCAIAKSYDLRPTIALMKINDIEDPKVDT